MMLSVSAKKPWMRCGALSCLFWAFWVLLWCWIAGCQKSTPGNDEEYLIRLGGRTVTLFDFNKALELCKTAYPHNDIQSREAARAIRIQLLNQLTEELVLLTRAAELNLQISDAELETAIADIREDYPEDAFEQTFLENAVSFDSWKKRLKIRLLMEKVVAKELESKVSITPEEVAAYYKENYQDEAAAGEYTTETEDVNALIISNLRREKAEASYKEWIKEIQKQYKIEINQDLWDNVINS